MRDKSSLFGAVVLVLFLVVAAVAAALFGVGMAGANAQPIEPLDVDLPITTVIFGTPGSTHPVGTIDAEPGAACTAELSEFRNEDSLHPDNDILLIDAPTGEVLGVFHDVESGTFVAAGVAFTAGGPVDVAVMLGSDGIFSAGFLLEVTCNPPTTTTTSTAPPTSSTVPTPTTTVAPDDATTTTLSPPPEGGVPAGGGSTAYSRFPAVEIVVIAILWIGAAVLAAVAYAMMRKDR